MAHTLNIPTINKRITWAEAEQIYSGIETEWVSMCGSDKTYAPPANEEWRLELVEWPNNGKVIYVIQLDLSNEWRTPPHWRRWPDVKSDAYVWIYIGPTYNS